MWVSQIYRPKGRFLDIVQVSIADNCNGFLVLFVVDPESVNTQVHQKSGIGFVVCVSFVAETALWNRTLALVSSLQSVTQCYADSLILF